MFREVFVGNPLVPSFKHLVPVFHPSRCHPPNLFTSCQFLSDLFTFRFADDHVHTVGGFHSPNAGALFLDNLLHGPCGFIHIHIAEFAPIDHDYLIRLFFSHRYPFHELFLKLMAVLMKPGFGVIDLLSIKEAFLFEMAQLKIHGTTSNNDNI